MDRKETLKVIIWEKQYLVTAPPTRWEIHYNTDGVMGDLFAFMEGKNLLSDDWEVTDSDRDMDYAEDVATCFDNMTDYIKNLDKKDE